MFGWMKKRHEADFEDIRSNVLSTPAEEPDFTPRRKAELEPAPRRAAPDFSDRMEPDISAPRFEEPPGFGSIDVRPQERARSRDYDIVERLNLIESQIAAVRNMTETINERLKNMEHQLPRRGY